jgi:hypothetical protein
MKHKSVVMLGIAFLLLGIAVVLSNCGNDNSGGAAITSNDAGSATGNATLSGTGYSSTLLAASVPPTYNATGTWNGTQTPVSTTCPAAQAETFTMTISHPAGSNSLTLNGLTCSISGDTISYSGPLAPEVDCSALGGSMTGTLNLTMNSATSMSGSFEAACSPFCSTIFNMTATKASSTGGGGSGGGGGCVMNPQAKTDLSFVILLVLSIYRISHIYWRKANHG